MKEFIIALKFDEYMRYVDFNDNKIPSKSCHELINGLSQHKNIVHFDIRNNPCFKENLKTQLAIRLVKNIEAVVKRKQFLKSKWIDPNLLKIHVPENFYEMIQQKYKVTINSSARKAKEAIIGEPIIDNFRSYSEKPK